MLGLIGKKIGMTQVFDEAGVLTSVTVIKFEENVVVSKRSQEKNGYSAVVLGTGYVKPNRVTKPYVGQFADGVPPKKHLAEIKDFEIDYTLGDKLGVEVLDKVDYVDVVGTTKGKGYQGVMKRHGFKGGSSTHGSKFHRGLGGTGMAATPSRVFKGTKMPGRMGGVQKTVQSLRVVGIDESKQVLLVAGAVPGRRNGVLLVRRAKKK